MPVNGPQVMAVKLICRTESGRDFHQTGGNRAGFETLESIEAGFTKLVFDGVSARIGVVRHALPNVR
jgi:hypothetical protein